MLRAFLLLTTTSLAFALATGPSLAQQNTLTIQQSGDGNSLFVDQSLASNSRVRGLIGEAAVQAGGNNRATITIQDGTNPSGGGAVFLEQHNNGAGVNQANVTSTNGGIGIVAQRGTGNSAALQVDGSQPSPLSPPFTGPLLSGMSAIGTINGAVIQNGDNNRASLATGLQTKGAIVQNGSDNNANLDLTLSNPGSSAVYSQNGNNLQSLTDVQVITNSFGTVAVTQTNSAGVTTRGAVSVTTTPSAR